MKIASDLFHGYSKCPMKCKLRAPNELAKGNDYVEWVKARNTHTASQNSSPCSSVTKK
jgi:hypothetical protein